MSSDAWWSQCPRWVRKSDWSHPNHSAVYMAVQFFAGPSGICFAERETIAEEAVVSVATVKRSLKVLAEHGALTIEHRHLRSSVIRPRLLPLRSVLEVSPELASLVDTAAVIESEAQQRLIDELRAEGASWSDVSHVLAGHTDPQALIAGLTDPRYGSHRPAEGSHRPALRVSQTRDLEEVLSKKSETDDLGISQEVDHLARQWMSRR